MGTLEVELNAFLLYDMATILWSGIWWFERKQSPKEGTLLGGVICWSRCVVLLEEMCHCGGGL